VQTKLIEIAGTIIQKDYLESDYERYWYMNTSVNSGGCLPQGVCEALERAGKKDFYSHDTIVKDRQEKVFASERGDKHYGGITDCTSGSCFYRDVEPNYSKWDAVTYPDIAKQLKKSIRTTKQYAKEGMPVFKVKGKAVCCIEACVNWMRAHGKL